MGFTVMIHLRISVKRGGGLLKMTEFKKFESCFKVYDDN